MAITGNYTVFDGLLHASRSYVQSKLGQMRKSHARRKIYNESYHALSQLSERGLMDLGLSRSSIKSRAMEVAYGK